MNPDLGQKVVKQDNRHRRPRIVCSKLGGSEKKALSYMHVENHVEKKYETGCQDGNGGSSFTQFELYWRLVRAPAVVSGVLRCLSSRRFSCLSAGPSTHGVRSGQSFASFDGLRHAHMGVVLRGRTRTQWAVLPRGPATAGNRDAEPGLTTARNVTR